MKRQYRDLLRGNQAAGIDPNRKAAGELAALLEIPLGRLNEDRWDADHIVPLVEGGTNIMENLRTLCLRCHRQETARLRRRLAEREALRRAN